MCGDVHRRDEGLPPCVFAALVPNSAERRVGELLEAVWRDHAAMVSCGAVRVVVRCVSCRVP
jgi:hypothetical protein